MPGRMDMLKLYMALITILLPLNYYALAASSANVKVSCTIPRRVQISKSDAAAEKSVTDKTSYTSRVTRNGQEVILKTAVAK